MNRDQYLNNPAFCPAPWTSVYIGPSGRIDNCCISENKLGTVNDGLDETIKGKKNFEIKQSMLDGKLVPGCYSCDQPKEVRTLRNIYLEMFDDLPMATYDIDNFTLNYVDLRWRNTCNSACVYCGVEHSSLWAQEINVAQKINTHKIDALKTFLEPRMAELKTVYLAGGEPMLIKENQWFLEKLLAVNPDCLIRVNTNLTAIDNPIFELLTQFNRVQWIISGETVGDVYEYIRFGSQWDVFQSNIEKLQQRVKPPHSITFLLVYCALSAPYMVEYLRFLQSKKLYEATVNYYNQGTGDWCDPRNLPEEVVQQCRKMIQDFLQQPGESSEYLIDSLKTVLSILDRPYEKNTEILRLNLSWLDERRKLDSRKIFPEIYQWIDK